MFSQNMHSGAKAVFALEIALFRTYSAADAGDRAKYQQKNGGVITASYLHYLHVITLKGGNQRLFDNCALQYLKFFFWSGYISGLIL